LWDWQCCNVLGKQEIIIDFIFTGKLHLQAELTGLGCTGLCSSLVVSLAVLGPSPMKRSRSHFFIKNARANATNASPPHIPQNALRENSKSTRGNQEKQRREERTYPVSSIIGNTALFECMILEQSNSKK
jgi:hypothetical protein